MQMGTKFELFIAFAPLYEKVMTSFSLKSTAVVVPDVMNLVKHNLSLAVYEIKV